MFNAPYKNELIIIISIFIYRLFRGVFTPLICNLCVSLKMILRAPVSAMKQSDQSKICDVCVTVFTL